MKFPIVHKIRKKRKMTLVDLNICMHIFLKRRKITSAKHLLKCKNTAGWNPGFLSSSSFSEANG